jgi:hypothetical protein
MSHKLPPFFVYVLESPSAPNLYHGRGEGHLIREAVKLNGLPCTVRCAISRVAFRAALRLDLLRLTTARAPACPPVLHISAHGFEEGIGLSNGEVLRWHELKDLLRPINRVLKGYLLVCMSSCKGYSGIRMAMALEDDDLPFCALVGTSGTPTWSETAVAYATLYHHICRGTSPREAVDAMRSASGHLSFFVETALQARQGFIEHLSSIPSAEIQQAAQEELAAPNPQEREELNKALG